VREARRWGLPGAAGLLLMCAALALLLVAVPRSEAARQADERALQQARVRAAAESAERARPQELPASVRFVTAFPEASERHRRITNLLSLASGLGLQPRRSELRATAVPDVGLTRVRLILPLSGSYLQLRRYLEQALRDDAALSLDQLRLERSDAGGAELRAEMHWSLWMRPAESAASAAAP
jgi:hypothetical protein